MEKLSQTIFGFFLDQIKPYFLNEAISFRSVEDESEVSFQNWMAIILISNSDFRLTVKVYCKESDILDLGKNAFSSLDDKSQLSISDFVKELANLLGGSIKRSFESAGVSSGLSLPLLVHAFDDLFFLKTSASETFLTNYHADGKSFFIQLYFEFLTTASKEKLTNLQIVNPSVGTGEFEFL
ncbi:MAG: hypothetical protein IPK04_18505 [Bdellovibrionales bacterium]|nr:hypothetical protein [Bdellovibrionales bacterium]